MPQHSFFFAMLFISLCGCLQTQLTDPTPPPTGILALSDGAFKAVSLRVELEEVSNYGGHQYILGVIPLGKIVLTEPDKRMFNELYEELAVNGYSVSLVPGNSTANKNLDLSTMAIDIQQSTETPSVLIKVKEASCTAYDLLVLRRNLCRLHVETVIARNGRVLVKDTFEDTESEWARFGFSPQLSVLMDRLLDRHSNHMLRLVQS